MAGNQSGWIVNGLTTAIGGGMAFYAWSGINAPAAVVAMPATPLLPTFTGGFFKRRRR